MAEVVIADYKQILKYVEKVIASLKDKDTAKYFTKLIESIRNASGLDIDPRDEDRRQAQLAFNAISLANQAVFSAFSDGDLTENLEREYRELPTLKDAQEALKTLTEEARKEEEELTAQLNAFRDRGRKYDLVHAVCAGRSVDEAKKMQKEYDKQMAQQPMKG